MKRLSKKEQARLAREAAMQEARERVQHLDDRWNEWRSTKDDEKN